MPSLCVITVIGKEFFFNDNSKENRTTRRASMLSGDFKFLKRRNKKYFFTDEDPIFYGDLSWVSFYGYNPIMAVMFTTPTNHLPIPPFNQLLCQTHKKSTFPSGCSSIHSPIWLPQLVTARLILALHVRFQTKWVVVTNVSVLWLKNRTYNCFMMLYIITTIVLVKPHIKQNSR